MSGALLPAAPAAASLFKPAEQREAYLVGMVPFIVLVTSFAVLRFLGRLGAQALGSWVTCLRGGLALMFLVTASAHWGARRPDLVRMIPPAFPNPELLVTFTGVAEIAGAVGLLVPRLAPWAAAGLAVLLVVVFPANVYAARQALTIGGSPATPLVTRTVLQLVFLAAVLGAGFGSRWLDAGGCGPTRRAREAPGSERKEAEGVDLAAPRST